jgi:hypothetical protein
LGLSEPARRLDGQLADTRPGAVVRAGLEAFDGVYRRNGRSSVTDHAGAFSTSNATCSSTPGLVRQLRPQAEAKAQALQLGECA